MVKKSIFISLVTVLFLTICSAQTVPTQQDSVPTFMIDGVVVTADRVQNTVASTTSSVSLISEQDIQRMPASKVPDILQSLPGFFVVNKDGLGREPIVGTRGFYGGGEAEYFLVLVDGIKINDVENGLVNWSFVPVSAISSIEVARGASSPLYGDAALGGIINIITSKGVMSQTNLFLQGGSFDSYSAGIRKRGIVSTLPYQFYFSNERTHGSRAHSAWQGTTFGGDILFSVGEQSSLKFSTLSQWTLADDPGPLSKQQFDADSKGSSAFYKADNRDERRNQVQLEYLQKLAENSELSAQLFYHNKTAASVRTFSNTAIWVTDPSTFEFRQTDTLFGDTKERDIATNEIGLSSKYSTTFSAGPTANRLIIGFEGSQSFARSLYHSVFGGLEEDYQQQNFGISNNALTVGEATRGMYALYVSDEMRFTERLVMTVGGRFDYIQNKYEGELPETTMQSNSSAFSPKIGLNYRFADGENYSGNVYATANRSFKAPTIDQLSDQRPIDAGGFVDFGGGPMFMMFPAAPFSNMDLKPQRSASYEVGTYSKMILSSNVFAEFLLSAYWLDIEDEIDFDLATFRYQNILESRHRGLEGGLKIYWMKSLSGFINYTWNNVTFAAGQYDGNFLKGIPRHTAALGVSYQSEQGVTASVVLNILSGMYLDDDNTEELPGYNPLSAKIGYAFSPLHVYVEANNLLNQNYASTGYILYGKQYLYPAAERMLRAGVEVQF